MFALLPYCFPPSLPPALSFGTFWRCSHHNIIMTCCCQHDYDTLAAMTKSKWHHMVVLMTYCSLGGCRLDHQSFIFISYSLNLSRFLFISASLPAFHFMYTYFDLIPLIIAVHSFYHLPFVSPLSLNFLYLWPLLHLLWGPVWKESLQQVPWCLQIHGPPLSVPWPLGDPLCPAQHSKPEVPRGR